MTLKQLLIRSDVTVNMHEQPFGKHIFEHIVFIYIHVDAFIILGSLDKKPCVTQTSNTSAGPNDVGTTNFFKSVKECMAYCDSIPACIAWDFGLAGDCNPKGSPRPTLIPTKTYIAGYCDSTQGKTKSVWSLNILTLL
jgi:hypothetical protein